MKKGILIAFEGIEGCGKTTQAKLLYEKLQKNKISSILTKEPGGGTEANKQIREILLKTDDLNVYTELFLFFADRAEHFTKEIIPSLSARKIVITDRCSASSIAYQYYGGGLDRKIYGFIKKADEIARHHQEINLNILLDGPVEAGLKRVKESRDTLTSFEKREIDFHNRVRAGFKKQASEDSSHWKIFDFTKSVQELQREIWDYINKKFKLLQEIRLPVNERGGEKYEKNRQ